MNNRLQSRDEGRDFDRSKVATMIGSRKCSVAVYVDRPSQQWVVRDPHGDFWLLPPVEDCWEQRRPFHLTDESELESVPGHYRYLLNLPF